MADDPLENMNVKGKEERGPGRIRVQHLEGPEAEEAIRRLFNQDNMSVEEKQRFILNNLRAAVESVQAASPLWAKFCKTIYSNMEKEFGKNHVMAKRMTELFVIRWLENARAI